MKKRIFILFIVVLTFLTGCNNDYWLGEIPYKEDQEHEPSVYYTYRFTGESLHFYFQTGKVYYNDNYRSLIISNFKVKENVSDDSSYNLILYFNDNYRSLIISNFKVKENVSDDSSYNLILYFNDDVLYDSGSANMNLSKSGFENIVITDNGYLSMDDFGNVVGEADSFIKTTKETFKDSIKMVINYCVKDKCKEETFKINYLD